MEEEDVQRPVSVGFAGNTRYAGIALSTAAIDVIHILTTG
jgi:hypothetical protein